MRDRIEVADMENFSKECWFTFSVSEQLGKVGIEYDRALTAKERSDISRFETVAKRTLQLMNLTVEDPRWQNHRQKELRLVREIILDQFYSEHLQPWSKPDLRNYFSWFENRARGEKARRRNTDVLATE